MFSIMNRWIGLLSAIVLGVSAFAQETSYVTVKQDGTGNYKSITEAINDPFRELSEIVVFAGIYRENIAIKENLTLRAYDGPNATAIDGNYHVQTQLATIHINPDLSDVKIIGFYITGGHDGVYVDTSSTVLVANCVLYENNRNGIYACWNNIKNSKTTVNLYNNVIAKNKENGVYLTDTDLNWLDSFPVTIKNNIIYANDKYGISLSSQNSSSPVLFSINYNNAFENKAGNYGPGIGENNYVVPGSGEISANPKFIGESSDGSGYDVRLLSASQCRDKGSNSPAFDDPDGTRNDMGAYGGPWATTFYEGPNDGPVVRSIRIVPGSVPQGGTFTIKAVGSVR